MILQKIFFTISVLIAVFAFSCTSSSDSKKASLQFTTAESVILIAKVDSILKRDTTQYVFVKATLKNNLPDTFEYFSMMCSWDEAFTTDHPKELNFGLNACYQNWWFIKKIPPFGSDDHIITLTVKAGVPDSFRFKMGYNLILPPTENPDSFMDSLKNMKHVIWSNSVTCKS